jgi:uncharacterized cupredoxin-like copper-binding protein
LRVALLLLLAAGSFGACSDGGPDGGRVIEISIEHSAFEPDSIEVEEGETVTFEITNDDPIDHEFILGDEEVQRIHEEGTEKHHDTRPGEISVPAGATAVTTYTFEEAGDLIYGCHIFGHYDYGMRGAVEVM